MTTPAIERVRAAEAARLEATRTNDAAALERLFAADLVYVHSSGKADTAAQYLDAMRSGVMRYDPDLEIHELSATDLGHAVLIAAKMVGQGMFGGKTYHVRSRTLAVWTDRDGDWRLVALQSTAVPNRS